MSNDVKSCQGCGASIYKEHLDRGLARFISGRLLCPVCIEAAGGPAAPRPVPPPMPAAVVPSAPEAAHDLPTISLVEPSEVPQPAARPAGAPAAPVVPIGAAHGASQFRRPLTRGENATRCRTFHGKLGEGAIQFLNDQINEWVDGNPDVEIKFATSSVGVFEGKHSEPHLFLTIFY